MPEVRRHHFALVGAGISNWLFAYDYPPMGEYGLDNGKSFPEVAAALSGASVSLVRLERKSADHRARFGSGTALPGGIGSPGAVNYRRRN